MTLNFNIPFLSNSAINEIAIAKGCEDLSSCP